MREMRDEIRKINKLVDEMTSLLMKRCSSEIDVKIKRENPNVVITIIDYNTTYSSFEIEELRSVLNIQRQCEVEEFYWELMGDDNKGDELFLVGSMIDFASVEKVDNNLEIVMHRKFLCKSGKFKG